MAATTSSRPAPQHGERKSVAFAPSADSAPSSDRAPPWWLRWRGLFRASDATPGCEDFKLKGKRMNLESENAARPVKGKVTVKRLATKAGGGHSEIYMGELRHKGCTEIVALKLLIGHVPEQEHQMFKREVHAWCRFDHPNIVPFYGTCAYGAQLFMVSPWMVNGNLMQYLQSNPDEPREKFIVQVANALVYLHDVQHTVHGDIKAQNVLVSNAGDALLTDFGLSTRLEKLMDDNITPAYIRTLGSSRFAAPELINDAPTDGSDAPLPSKTEKSDVFAFGMFVLQVFTGKLPWADVPKTLQVFKLVLEGEKPERPDHLIDDQFWSVAKQCWEYSPDRRPHMRDILKIIDRQDTAMRFGVRDIVADPVPISSGAMTDVFRGRWIRPDQPELAVALKAFRIKSADPDGSSSGTFPKRVRRELEMWKGLHHPHILPVYGTALVGRRFSIVTPWMENRDCIYYLKAHPNADRLRIATLAGMGVAYLHKQSPPILHMDLRASNVLIAADGTPMVADFGLSRLADEGQEEATGDSVTVFDSIRWTAPELFGDSQPTTRSDVYAFAMLILEIFTENVPFVRLSSQQVILRVTRGERPLRPDHDLHGLSDDIWRVMEQCWSTEPSRRPTMDVIVSRLEIILHSQ